MITKKDVLFTVIDLETTGFNEYEDDIIEVGLVQFNGLTGEAVGSFNAFVKTDKKISKKVSELTGIDNDMVDKFGLDKETVSNIVNDFCKGSVVIAHNVQFDFRFLKVHFNIEPYAFYDTLAIAQLEYPYFSNHKLGTLAEEFGADLSNAHRALNDADATKDIFIRMVQNNEEILKKYVNALANGKYGISYQPKHTREIFN